MFLVRGKRTLCSMSATSETYNHSYILEFFIFLQNLFFAANEIERDYLVVKKDILELPHKILNNLRLII